MREDHGSLYFTALTLAILSTCMLIYNMIAISIFREQVFIKRGTISPGGELAILIGFILVSIFSLVSLLWHARQ